VNDDVIADDIKWNKSDINNVKSCLSEIRLSYPGFLFGIIDRLVDKAIINICDCNKISSLDLILESFEDYHRLDSGLRCKHCNNRRYLLDIISNGASISDCAFMFRYLLLGEVCNYKLLNMRACKYSEGHYSILCEVCDDRVYLDNLYKRGLLK